MDPSELDSKTKDDVNVFLRHHEESGDVDNAYDIEELVKDADEVR